MATRNKTEYYLDMRRQKSATRGKFNSPTKDPNVHLLEDSSSQVDIELGGEKMKLTVPPSWMAAIEDVHYNVAKIKENMDKLSELHKVYLLPQFNVDDASDETGSIDVLTDFITKTFQQTHNKIQFIGKQAVGPQEESMKKNIQSSLALQLQNMSLAFKASQRDYLQRLQGIQARGRNLPTIDLSNDEAPDIGFTPEQLKILDDTTVTATQRDQDIKQIVKSITELATIFKELQTLVIEQGTILDSIEYNVETTSHNVDQGVKELAQASTIQKSYRKKIDDVIIVHRNIDIDCGNVSKRNHSFL